MLKVRRLSLLLCAAILVSSNLMACSDDSSVDGTPDTGINNGIEDAGDAGTDATDEDVEPDVGDEDVDVEPDVSDDTDVVDSDTGEEPACPPGDEGWLRDSDQDGLSDCEERSMCTSEFNHDTDGDGLSDLEELQLGTDPCNPDTDGDGLSDYDEIRFGFDPQLRSTYGDGIDDGDRWIVTACDDSQSEPVDYHQNSLGDWTLALPPAFNSYANLTIAGADFQNRLAAAVYDDPANEITGFVLSTRPTAAQTAPGDIVRAHRTHVGALGSLLQESVGGEFGTHDFHSAAIGRYLIRSNTGRTPRQIRDLLLGRLVPGGADAISGLPAASGNSYHDYRLILSVIHRGNQALTMVAFAPAHKFETHDKTKFRMDDLTNTTNVAGATDSQIERCTTFRPGLTTPQVDFYWVLDQSGSMNDDFQRVREVASEFFSQLNNTPLDWRLGVANMAESTQGRLRNPPAWHTSLPTFLNEIEDYVVRCTGCGSNAGGAEYGLDNARRGLEYMLSNQAPSAVRVRPEAKVVTIIMSDEEDQMFQSGGGVTSPGGQARLTDHISFFTGRTTMFSIVSQGSPCGQNAQAYIQVALATGGSFYDLCSNNIEEPITDIIISATGGAASHVLPDTPVSSSLRVFKDGQWVPRSRTNGFDYFANTNSIAFFGSFRPDPESNGATDHIAVTYRHYQKTTKPDTRP